MSTNELSKWADPEGKWEVSGSVPAIRWIRRKILGEAAGEMPEEKVTLKAPLPLGVIEAPPFEILNVLRKQMSEHIQTPDVIVPEYDRRSGKIYFKVGKHVAKSVSTDEPLPDPTSRALLYSFKRQLGVSQEKWDLMYSEAKKPPTVVPTAEVSTEVGSPAPAGTLVEESTSPTADQAPVQVTLPAAIEAAFPESGKKTGRPGGRK